MNFTGTRTAPGLGKRINWHLATVAAGFALAASLVVASGVFEGSDGGIVPEPPARISPASSTNAGDTPQVVMYIVGSEAEGLALQQQTFEAGHEAPGVDRHVLVAEYPESEAAVLAAIGESMQLTGFELIDLR